MRRTFRKVFVKETFEPIPNGMMRLKFERGGRNVEMGDDFHKFNLGDYDLILKGHDVNRIKMGHIFVYEHIIKNRRVYSDFGYDELLERI